MKRIYNHIFAIFCAVFCIVSVEAQTTDTLLNVANPTKVIITEKSTGTSVIVKGVKGNDMFESSVMVDYPAESSVASKQSTSFEGIKPVRIFGDGLLSRFRSSGKGKWDVVVDGVCLGLTKSTGIGVENGPEWSKSIEIGWLSCLSVGYFYKNRGITLGLGFDWRNYKITTSEKRLVATPGKGIELDAYPADSHPKNSRLKIFSLQLPLLYRLDIPKTSLNLKLGPIFNFNTYGSVKTIYITADGNKVDDFSKDIKPRRFTVDFFGSISLSNTIGIYLRYSPMKVMDAPNSLNFRPLTIGVGIGI